MSTSILAAPSSALTSSAGPSPTAATSSRPASSASSIPNPASRHGTSAAKIAAIVVPIVAVILIIPLIFLLFRSHQIKKAEERRRSQRSSGEAMLQRPSSISKGEAPQIAQQSFGGTGNTGNASSPRPTNSLGLFNFDFGPLKSPSLLSPASPRSPARLSVAHAISVRRSQPHVVNARGSGAAPPNHRTSQQSQHSMLLSDPVPPYTGEEASDPHFAPLNSIGIAHTRSNSRPTFQRQPSSGAVSALSRPSHDGLRPSDAYGHGHARAPSPGVLPPIPNGALNWGGRFTVSDYDRIDRRSEISALSESEYSDDPNRRISRQSQVTVKDNGGMQPHRII